ncbi:hypothetical protein VE02_03749 [Pseudogymnoascus sp. 03VT05]|nr:hypothetical protein VE02_03749 [Pseudogymnoascus sp. 03VT05]
MPSTPTRNPPPPLFSHSFTSIPKTRTLTTYQINRLCDGSSRAQYLLGRSNGSHIFPKCVRLTYDIEMEEMVVKVMGAPGLDSSHQGMDGEELVPIGSTTCRRWGAEREPDSSYKPRGRGDDGWPTLVTLVGFKEAVEGLRWDAGWFVGGSEEEVRVAIIIILHPDERKIVLETWEPGPDDGTRVTRLAPRKASRTQEICISEDEVEGAPLVLGFEKVFGRAAGEG